LAPSVKVVFSYLWNPDIYRLLNVACVAVSYPHLWFCVDLPTPRRTVLSIPISLSMQVAITTVARSRRNFILHGSLQ